MAALLAAALAVPSVAQEPEPEEQLEALRERIEALQSRIQKESERRDASLKGLRRAEQRVAEAARELRALQDQREAAYARRKALIAEAEAEEEALEAEREALGGQIRTAYMSGRQERVKLLLNQQDPARLGRIMVYYRYLTATRARQIESVVTRLETLDRLARDVEAETARLASLETRQARKLNELQSARDERAAAVAAAERRLKSRGAELDTLNAEQAGLEALIEDLRKALAELPGTRREPFASQRGLLDWPVRGRLLHNYGQSRAGGRLKWSGVTVAADRGTEVQAIYHGRVAYADWLPGMGLLVVLEHGDGYMSLYGHNEALFKTVGDWVQPGETIASAGDTGGRDEAALYFEIRRGTQPLNPHRWFRTRLSAR